MNLAKGKNQRMQIFVLVGIFVIGGLYALFSFVIIPTWDQYNACVKRVGELQVNLRTANNAIREARTFKETNESLRKTLRDIDERYIVKAEYNDYSIRAREQIEKFIAAAGLKLENVLPDGQFFAIARKPESRLKSFQIPISVNVAGPSSFENIVTLLRVIETNNPYMFVTKLHIEGQPDPFEQKVSFTVSWPVWENPAIISSFVVGSAESGEGVETAPAVTPRKRGARR